MKLQCDECLDAELDLEELGLDEFVDEETGEIDLAELSDQIDPVLYDEGWELKCTLLDDGCLMLVAKCPDCAAGLVPSEEPEEEDLDPVVQEELDALNAELGEETPSAGSCSCCCCQAPAPEEDPEDAEMKRLAEEEIAAIHEDLGD